MFNENVQPYIPSIRLIARDRNTVVSVVNLKRARCVFAADERRIHTYLILCKNSVETTKEALDQYYTVKSVVPEYFGHRDPTSPALEQSMSTTQGLKRFARVEHQFYQVFETINIRNNNYQHDMKYNLRERSISVYIYSKYKKSRKIYIFFGSELKERGSYLRKYNNKSKSFIYFIIFSMSIGCGKIFLSPASFDLFQKEVFYGY